MANLRASMINSGIKCVFADDAFDIGMAVLEKTSLAKELTFKENENGYRGRI